MNAEPNTPLQSSYEPLTREQVEGWRKKIKDKIFSDFCGEPNEAHGRKLQADFDGLCSMAVNALLYAEEIERLRTQSESGLSGPTFEQIRDAIAVRMGGHTIDARDADAWRTFLNLLRMVKPSECAIASKQSANTSIEKAMRLLKQAAERIAATIAADDDGRTDPLLAGIHSFLNAADRKAT